MAPSLFRSAVFRLVLLTVALVGLAAAVMLAGVGYVVSNGQTERTEAAIRADVVAFRRAYADGGREGLDAIVHERSASGSGLYFLGDGRGGRRQGNLASVPVGLVNGASGGTFTYPVGGASGHRLAAGVAIDIEAGTPLVIARDIEEQGQLLASLSRGLAWGLGAVAVVGLAAALWLTSHIQRRIDAISDASRAIMAGNLAGRIPRQGSDDELDRLADQLNAMLERIERLMAGMREVSDNIAHDLKTPLNRLRNRAEAALADARGGPAWRDGLERTIEDADDLIKTFNALLLIARLEAGAIDDATETFDAVALCRDVAELYEPAAEEAGFLICLAAEGTAMVRANRQLVAQAIANLIDNALKYSDRGVADRRITVRVVASPEAVALSVGDRGPGIPAADRTQALRRFGRLEASRTKPGTGLGLSLVSAVARMHGGTVTLDDHRPGLLVTLALPAVAAHNEMRPATAPANDDGERV